MVTQKKIYIKTADFDQQIRDIKRKLEKKELVTKDTILKYLDKMSEQLTVYKEGEEPEENHMIPTFMRGGK